MSGERNLGILLASIDPELGAEEYVFHTMDASFAEIARMEPWAVIHEKEGLTLILERAVAEKAGIETGSVFRRITLNVHSSLDAVGLTAAVATRLAGAGISANVVAGYFHDHVFVGRERAEEAVGLLRGMAEEALSGNLVAG
jgi:uncharacterized protein